MSGAAAVGYVDETFRDPARGVAGYYQLTALVVNASDLASAESAILRIEPTDFKASKLASQGRHQRVERMLDEVVKLNCWNLIAVTTGHTSDQEGARQRCMTELLIQLEKQRATDVICDSRESVLGPDPEVHNRKDQTTLTALKRSQTVDRHMNMTHKHDEGVPLLWVPDGVGWAYRQFKLRDDDSYWSRVESVTSTYEI